MSVRRFSFVVALALAGACALAPAALAYRGVAITVENKTSDTLIACGWNGQAPVERGQGVPTCGSGPADIAPQQSMRFTGDFHASLHAWDTVVQVRLRQSATQRWADALPVVCGAGRNPAAGRPDFQVSGRWAFDPIYARRPGVIWDDPPAAYRRCRNPWWTTTMSEPDSRDFSRPAFATGTVRRNDDSSWYEEFVVSITATGAASTERTQADGAWMTQLANASDANGNRVGDLAKVGQVPHARQPRRRHMEQHRLA